QRLFRAGGAFRDLRILSLCDGQGQMRIPVQLKPPSQPDRQIRLLLSDCTGEHWWSGAIQPLLAAWSSQQAFAILQILPRRMWERTFLGQGQAISLSNSKPAEASARYNESVLRQMQHRTERRRKPSPEWLPEPDTGLR
ncbi:MAG: hypothetical protein ACK53L_01775, partial [Pirellulaceae bacterium]